MKHLFADNANISEIIKANEMGAIQGGPLILQLFLKNQGY